MKQFLLFCCMSILLGSAFNGDSMANEKCMEVTYVYKTDQSDGYRETIFPDKKTSIDLNEQLEILPINKGMYGYYSILIWNKMRADERTKLRPPNSNFQLPCGANACDERITFSDPGHEALKLIYWPCQNSLDPYNDEPESYAQVRFPLCDRMKIPEFDPTEIWLQTEAKFSASRGSNCKIVYDKTGNIGFLKSFHHIVK